MIDWKKGPNPSQKAMSSYALVVFMPIKISTNPKELQDQKNPRLVLLGYISSTD